MGQLTLGKGPARMRIHNPLRSHHSKVRGPFLLKINHNIACNIIHTMCVQYKNKYSFCACYKETMCRRIRTCIYSWLNGQYGCEHFCPSVILSICPSVHLSIRPAIYLSIRLCVHPSVSASVLPNVYLSVLPSVCLTTCSSVSQSVRLFLHPSVRPSVRQSDRHPLSVCPSDSPSVRPSTL
jgi:hypothetical protein